MPCWIRLWGPAAVSSQNKIACCCCSTSYLLFGVRGCTQRQDRGQVSLTCTFRKVWWLTLQVRNFRFCPSWEEMGRAWRRWLWKRLWTSQLWGGSSDPPFQGKIPTITLEGAVFGAYLQNTTLLSTIRNPLVAIVWTWVWSSQGRSLARWIFSNKQKL